MKRRKPSYRVKLNPDRMWKLMHRRNISQNELAKLGGMSSGYLSLLMRGMRCPSPERRRRLMKALGVTQFDDMFILETVS